MGEYPELETQPGYKTAQATPPSLDSRSALAVGTLLDGRYTIGSVLHNQSQFSIVYLADDNELRRQVVIKEFFPRDYVVRASDATVAPESTCDKRPFDDAMAGFLEEGRKLANIHHVGIVDIYGAFKQNGTAYLVMEKVAGQTLAAFRVRGESVDRVTFSAVFGGLVEALREVHANDIIHRDIKPNNVMIRDKNGQPVLIDFGAARQSIGAAARDFTKVFTPGFSPPEQTSQRRDHPPGNYSDLYSMAATLLAWVSDSRPPDSNDRMHAIIDNHPDPMPKFKDLLRDRGINPSLLAALDNCLDLRSANRPQSVADLLSQVVEEKPQGKGSARKMIPRWVVFSGIAVVVTFLFTYWELILSWFGIIYYQR